MKKSRRTFAARLVADLRPALQGLADPIALGIGFDGAIYTVTLKEKHGISTSPKNKLKQTIDYLVIRWQDGQIQTLLIPGEVLVTPLWAYVQPFPGGVLLVDSRCCRGAEKNAVTFDWSGRQLARFTLGDGIEDLRVTRNGTIWVSYFDEGVFAGCDGRRAIGAPGLVAFLTTGKVCFSYDYKVAHTDAIYDAYAMNVASDDDVWLYFYSDFPIVRILDGTYHVWNPGVSGAKALAVRKQHVLLFGDYEHKSLGRIVELGNNGMARVVEEILFVDDQGNSIPVMKGTTVYGVGEDLFFFKDRRVLIAGGW